MAAVDIDALLADFRAQLAQAGSPAELEELKRTQLGKKSPIKAALKGLGALAPDERKAFAQRVNEARQTMEDELQAAASVAEARALAAQLEAEWQDLSMPGVATPRGALHPVTQAERRMMEVLRTLGFVHVDGPEVEHPYYNFDALNIPEHHPARDMQDTFWVDQGWLLRSHTTTVQARVMSSGPTLPVKIACYGRVYRNEAVDATHTAMFHQFEGLWVEPGLTFGHLKGVLNYVIKAVYGDQPTRFKPKFYPYTEPSVGVDLQCRSCAGGGCQACGGAGWLTILGAGMVHPKLLIEFGFDPMAVSGIAFGLGTTRIGAQAAGVTKARTLYEQDLRVHQRIHRGEP